MMSSVCDRVDMISQRNSKTVVRLIERSWMRSTFACLLVLFLSGCPEDPVTPEMTEQDMNEEDQSTFTFDLDLPDRDVPDEDMGMEDMGPQADTTCDSCEDDGDCGDGYQCIAFAVDGGDKRCFKPCEEASDEGERCAEGASCLTLTDDLEVCVADEREECERLCYDPDGDGYGPGGVCDRGDNDCNSEDAAIFPGAEDVCDGVNNDCDDSVDEAFTPEVCGEGTCTAQSSCEDGVIVACVPPEVADSDATCDGQDDDCDGSVDEDYAATSCGEGACAAESACVDGAEQTCTPSEMLAIDDLTCDGIDEDCDGRVDESFTDSCGQGICVRSATCENGATLCTPREPELGEVDALCDNIDQDCDGQVDEGFVTEQTCGLGACQVAGSCVNGAYACEPTMPTAVDDATCDGVDEDCDGEVDEDCQVNTLRVSYNSDLSTATTAALDVYYDQTVSPARLPENYQPTLALIAVTFPQGMGMDFPFLEGSTFALGQSVVDSGKSVSVRIPPDEPNTRQFVIQGLFEPAASSFITPSTEGVSTNDGRVLTLFFDINGVAAPWNFSWSVGYTQFAPAAAMEVLNLTPIAPLSP